MNTKEIVAFIKLKLKKDTGNENIAPQLGILDILTDIRNQSGETNYFKVQDALQEMTEHGWIENRDKGMVIFNSSVLN